MGKDRNLNCQKVTFMPKLRQISPVFSFPLDRDGSIIHVMSHKWEWGWKMPDYSPGQPWGKKLFKWSHLQCKTWRWVEEFQWDPLGPRLWPPAAPVPGGKRQPQTRKRKFLLQVFQDVIVGLRTEICPFINLNLLPAQTWEWRKVSNLFPDLSGSSRSGSILVLRGVFVMGSAVVWANLSSTVTLSSEWCWSCYK